MPEKNKRKKGGREKEEEEEEAEGEKTANKRTEMCRERSNLCSNVATERVSMWNKTAVKPLSHQLKPIKYKTQ